MMNNFKAVAIAAATVALMPVAAHATPFGAGSLLTFTFSDTVTSLEGPSLTIGVSGSANLIPGVDANGNAIPAAAVTMAGTALDLNGTSVNTWANTGSGITLSGSGSTIVLTDFLYTQSNRYLTFNYSINGGAPQAGLFTASTSSTTTPFTTSPLAGTLKASNLKLNLATANAIANGLGLTGYGLLLSTVSFGDITIQAVAVPEPSTYALMGLGLGAAAMLARRRKAA